MCPRNLLLMMTIIGGIAWGLRVSLPTPRPTPAAEVGRTSLISYAPGRLPSGMPGTYNMEWAAGDPCISANGSRVAFATNIGLVPTDTNRITDIYLYDRPARRHILASPTLDGRGAAGVALSDTAVSSRISADGHLVAFSSAWPALVAGDSLLRSAVFLFDSASGKVRTIARDYESSALDAPFGPPDVAVAAGQIRVVFASASSRLVPDDGNGVADVFVYDLASGKTTRVSVSAEGGDANGPSAQPALSDDGGWVAFVSSASNLVSGDHNARADVFLRDLVHGETVRVSSGRAGAEADGDSQRPAIAGDGGRVVFRSMATNLAPGDTNGVADIFVYDRALGDVTLVSVGGGGASGDQPSGDWSSAGNGYAISHDGRFVAFTSQPSDAVPGPSALFVHDLTLKTTAELPLAVTGRADVGAVAIADGGRRVVFTAAAVLSPMLVDSATGVFLHDRDATASPPGATITMASPAQVLQAPLGELTLRGQALRTVRGQTDRSVGYAWVSSLDGLIAQAPEVSLAATGLSAGRHSLTFIVIDSDGEAAASTSQAVTVVAPAGRQVRTLILTNPARLRALYPGDPQVCVLDRRLLALAVHPDVAGQIIDVGADQQTVLAYAAWDREPTTERANQVAARIKAQVDRAWRLAPTLEYLVIVGDDRVIPFRRVPDAILECYPELRSEAQFAALLAIPAATTVGRALQDNQILTDDYYASSPTHGGFGAFPAPRYDVPALGTGRLVEAPAEILEVVEAFLERDRVMVTHGAVSAEAGDFAGDLGARACALMASQGLTVDCALVTQPWSAEAFRGRLLAPGAHNEILDIEHHASPLWFGSAGEFVYARDLAGAHTDLARAMIISVGCHAGLTVPPYASSPSFDLPQAALSRQANFLGSTGYSVASQEQIRWSEALIELFERALLSGEEVTPGRALVAAKAYYQQATFFSCDGPSDEKASLQLTLYGLPMYQYVISSAALAGD